MILKNEMRKCEVWTSFVFTGSLSWHRLNQFNFVINFNGKKIEHWQKREDEEKGKVAIKENNSNALKH